MGVLLSIDPGNVYSGWVTIDTDTYKPLMFGKDTNDDLLDMIYGSTDESFIPESTSIEMIASYGMPVGSEVFDTCVWIGRFWEAIRYRFQFEPDLIYRKPVAMYHCQSVKGNDASIKQALVDRFAKGVGNYGKGTKNEPGFFYGFRQDVWSAYAIAVYYNDLNKNINYVIGSDNG